MSQIQPSSLTAKLVAAMSMIKVAHTIFAMPFAVVGWVWGIATVHEAASIDPRHADLAERSLPVLARNLGFEAAPWLWTLIWVVVAMVGARSFAMAFNRIVDRHIDARNPRTAGRELPKGVLSLRFAWGLTSVSALLFLVAAAMLNHQTLILAPVALVIIGGYSLTKRCTALCHVVLGLGLALAPAGGWLAAVGRPWEIVAGVDGSVLGLTVFERLPDAARSIALSLSILLQPSVVLLATGIVCWVSGFDVIYSLQDEAFDRRNRLHSLPALLGARTALLLSRILHGAALVCWLFAVLRFGDTVDALVAADSRLSVFSPEHVLGILSYAGLGVIGACLLYEHSLVKHDDLSRVDAAFFTMNGAISIVFALLIVCDVFFLD